MTPTATTTTELPPEPASPAAARRFVTGALQQGHVPPATIEVVQLLTSELVTNAAVHARSPIVLSVTVTARAVRVAVEDAEGSTLAPGAVDSLDTHGRGLTIVGALADDWGVERRDGGKSVWFELLTASG
jgi:anti-sigma regulatory factor (Ser/Thr protein kinase)